MFALVKVPFVFDAEDYRISGHATQKVALLEPLAPKPVPIGILLAVKQGQKAIKPYFP